MPRTFGAVAAVALAVALPVHADGQPGDEADNPPLAVADRTPKPPAVVTIPRKTQNDWLHALTHKAEGARAALEGYTLVVTSGDSKVKTFTHDDLEKSLQSQKAAGDELPEAARTQSAAPEEP